MSEPMVIYKQLLDQTDCLGHFIAHVFSFIERLAVQSLHYLLAVNESSRFAL